MSGDDTDRSSDADPTDPASHSGSGSNPDPGPGCMPAILAATALIGMVGFIVCALSTWFLFQKRTELAIRTLRGSFVGQVEQSLLDPQTKLAVLDEVETLCSDLEQGKYENWQAAGIMQRLQRLPVLQWGELQAVESFLNEVGDDNWGDAEKAEALKQLGRLRRAVEMGKATSFDFEEVLKPIRRPLTSSPTGSELVLPLESQGVRDTIRRAKLVADRAEVPDQDFQNLPIEQLLREVIEQGAAQGGY